MLKNQRVHVSGSQSFSSPLPQTSSQPGPTTFVRDLFLPASTCGVLWECTFAPICFLSLLFSLAPFIFFPPQVQSPLSDVSYNLDQLFGVC